MKRTRIKLNFARNAAAQFALTATSLAAAVNTLPIPAKWAPWAQVLATLLAGTLSLIAHRLDTAGNRLSRHSSPADRKEPAA